jgi:GT2 family glycosyltransferase
VKKSVAVLQCLYGGDRADWAELSFASIAEQEYGTNSINYYLCIDGPIGGDLQAVVDARRSCFRNVLTNPDNLGLARSLNHLISVLEDEEFVFRMDSDDVSLPTRFGRQIQAMAEQPAVGICGTALIEMDGEGRRQRQRNYYRNHEQVVRNMYKGTAVGHPTVCFRRSALDLLGGYNDRMTVSQDIELWFRAIANGVMFYNVQEPLLLFRKSRDFYSRRAMNKALKEFAVYWRGCNALYGLGWRNLYPMLRLLFRMAPHGLSHVIYDSGVRRLLYRQAH